MININNILDLAIEKNASDCHFIVGNKPVLRIRRELVGIESEDVITEKDIWQVYEFLINNNKENDEYFKKNRVLDVSREYKDVRLRVNASYSNGVPTITTRIILGELPKFETLGIPDVVRSTVAKAQGLILVTGKTNSGKTTTLNVLIDYINKTQNKKILTLESPVEYRHKSKKSVIVQKEVGPGGDILKYSVGTKNSLREDCDILVIGEIRDRETMDAAIETAESGHLVIGTLHTKSCAETLDRMINFYDIQDQTTMKYLIASLLKMVLSQRLLPGQDGSLVLVPEVMVVENLISGIIRKEQLKLAEIEDAIQLTTTLGSIGLINSLAKLHVENKLSLETCKSQIEARNYGIFEKMVEQQKILKATAGSDEEEEEEEVIEENATLRQISSDKVNAKIPNPTTVDMNNTENTNTAKNTNNNIYMNNSTTTTVNDGINENLGVNKIQEKTNDKKEDKQTHTSLNDLYSNYFKNNNNNNY